MNREVQSVLLILLGSAITRIALTDVYLRYVKETLQPFLVATGIILFALGVLALVDIIRSSRKETGELEHAALVVDHADGSETVEPIADSQIGAEAHDGHGHGEMRIAWLLLLPVLSILLVAPPALGAYSAEKEPSTVLQPVADFDPIPPGNPAEISLSEYAVRAVWDDGNSLEGREIQLTGFVTPVPEGAKPNDLPSGATATWWVTRLSLACCAADASVTKILAVDTPKLPPNTWVQIVGMWIPGGGTESDRAIPWIEVQSIKQVPQPANPYE